MLLILLEFGGYIIFFFLGEIIKRYKSLFHLILDSRLLAPLGILWLVSMWLYFYVNGIAYNTDAVDVVTYEDFLPKLISLFFFFNLFINFRHNRLFDYFDKYGKQTLIIYLVHFLVLNYVADKVLSRFTWAFHSAGIVRIVILVVVGWFASILMCYLSDKCRVTNCVFYTKKYVDKCTLKFGFFIKKV